MKDNEAKFVADQSARPMKIPIINNSAFPDTGCCPYYNARASQFRPIPICEALPIFVPLSASRTRFHCHSSDFATCPHFTYAMHGSCHPKHGTPLCSSPVSRLIMSVSESLWVIGIPLSIVVFIITALLLTQ